MGELLLTDWKVEGLYSMLTDLTIKEFLERVASGEPVPGGGSVAALAAALSASLSEMVAGLTLSKAKGGVADERMTKLIYTASRLRARLINDVDNDSEAYAAVMKAYRMPKGSLEEQDARRMSIQNALKGAVQVPLSVAETGLALMTLAKSAITEGNSNAVTDALVAALMARSAVIGAIYNVRINLASLEDKPFRDRMSGRAYAIEQETIALERKTISLADSMIKTGV